MRQLTIGDVKELAIENDTDQIIVIQINRETRNVGLTTYGKTKEMCGHAAKLGDMAYDLILSNYADT